MSNSVQPHRQQPTRLPHPWDSPGKNTGVGCHFLLQCMKVNSESEVSQSCLTHSDPMDCSPPGSSVHGIFQVRVLEWVAIVFSGSSTTLYYFIVMFYRAREKFKVSLFLVRKTLKNTQNHSGERIMGNETIAYLNSQNKTTAIPLNVQSSSVQIYIFPSIFNKKVKMSSNNSCSRKSLLPLLSLNPSPENINSMNVVSCKHQIIFATNTL